MPYTPFTLDEVRRIFVQSEQGTGHAGARHVDITNAAMWDRMQGSRGSRAVAAITSFVKFDDQLGAALELLNSPANDAALEQFRCEHKPGRPYFAIQHRLAAPVQMRYAIGGGTRTFPCTLVRLILEKKYGRPRNMHVVTFFGEFG
ncbi:hypothetical protein GCM10011371_14360 [Novosphingobium marinum]|uniref:Uncharacterized protein n=1 Tax=Novosphingobium marinum TaxID=1514948 RepID=A0A7Y9XVV7_9SPHN|nr:RNase A-like domain-containing protein [Novosphingobium marinum]NYH95549.1 hypothetical protein [Novosphingobium marinum]GGC27977.1 hypothetical protein GCM10011371_14360 [Novosphingobium marinum]